MLTRKRRHAGAVTAACAAMALMLSTAPAALGGSGSGSGGSSGSGSGGGGNAAANFVVGANYSPPNFFGRLVRGGLPTCLTCTTSVEPRYPVTGFTTGWDSNFIGVTSLNGFSGTVTIQVQGLPAGVVSRTATSVTVPRGGATSTPFALRAGSDAALGDFTVTVRATAGTRTHSVMLPVTLTDALPS